jgi:hypothetical protein
MAAYHASRCDNSTTDEETFALPNLLMETAVSYHPSFGYSAASGQVRATKTAGLAPDALLTTGAQGSGRNYDRSFPMPNDAAPPAPVWSVKFFRDLRSQTPTRLAYNSRSSEAEVVQRALERMADEEAARVEICRVLLNPPILADGAEYWLD